MDFRIVDFNAIFAKNVLYKVIPSVFKHMYGLTLALIDISIRSRRADIGMR